MRQVAGWIAVVLLALPSAGFAQAPATQPAPVWELRDGNRWTEVTNPSKGAVPNETLDRIEEMLQNRQATAAKRMAVAWLRANKDAPDRDRGIYLLGQANFQYGDRIMSFYNFDELLDKFPDSRFWYPALERQYDIADQFLKGYKRRFLGFPLLEAKTEATEMLYRIQQRAPGSPLAEKALLRTADHYYADGDFDIAADAYGYYVRNYPRSPYLPRVRLRQAFSSLAQFRGIRFDATPIVDARQQLVDLAATYPQLAEEENAAAIIHRIDTALAKKLLETGRFYRRTHKPAASAYYWRLLLSLYPDFPEAQEAKDSLSKLPAWALNSTLPPGYEEPADSSAAPRSSTRPAEAR